MQNYKIYEELGIGNSGSKIFRVRQHGSLVFQAAHEFNTSVPVVAQSIKHQVHILNQLQHPNIISIISYFQTNTGVTLVTELCQPYTLQKLILKDKVLPINSIAIFSADLRDALSYLHQNQILYNDLCPQNILLNQNGVLKLFEFESACTISKSKPLDTDDIERSIRKCGYMHRAPETLLKDGIYSYASDFYSLGCSLYFLAFNRFPFQDLDEGDYVQYAQKVLSVGKEHLKQNIPPLDSQQQLPQEFYELIFMLLQPVPFQRGSWSDLQKFRFFNTFGEQLLIKEQNQPSYVLLLIQLCKDKVFGEDYINLQFDKKGKVIVESEAVIHTQNNDANILMALQKQKQLLQSAQDQKDAANSDQEFSQGADMTVKQIKKQSQLKYLVNQTDEYYQQLKNSVQGNKFNHDLFISTWAGQVSAIIIGRNKQQFKLQPLIAIDIQKDVQLIKQLNIQKLLSLKVEQFLQQLEIILKDNIDRLQDIYQDQQNLFKLLVHIVEIIKCAQSKKLNIANDSRINSDELIQPDILDRIMACMTVLLFDQRSQLIQLFQTNKLQPFQELFQLFITHKLYLQTLTGLTLYCEFITIIYHFIQVGAFTVDQYQVLFGVNLIHTHNEFISEIDTKLRNIDLNQLDKKQIIQHLSKCIVYYNFCQNNIQLTIMLLEQELLIFNIFSVINYTDFLTVSLNIFMATHEDNFVTQLKQIGGSLINKLFDNCTFRASQAMVLLTDLRLAKFIDFNQITPSYFDFPRVMHDISSTRNILHALQQCLLLEHFSVFDIVNQKFIINNRKTKRTESFITQNIYRILNLQQFPAQDDSLLACVAILLSSILMTDEFLEPILKNPMNAGNTKLFRILQIQDVKFESKLDEMIQRAGIKYKNKFLLQAIAQLVTYFQFFFDLNLTSIRSFAITSIYVNHKYYAKCFHGIDVIIKLCSESFQSYTILITQKQIQALESILFSLANTIFGIRPPCLPQIQEHKDVMNFYEHVDENFYQYVTKIINLAVIYLNSPWNKQIREFLFYQLENKKTKGIWYSIISLIKDPYQISSINQQNPEINKFAIKIFKYLRTEMTQVIYNSLQKFIELGPCIPSIYSNQQFQQDQDNFILLGDNLSIGLIQGEIFSIEIVEKYTELAKTVMTRFIQSKSMYQDIFILKDLAAQYALKIGILACKVLGPVQELQQIAIDSLNGPAAVVKPASDLIEQFIMEDPNFWFQQIGRIDFYKQQPDLFLPIIRTLLVQLKIGFQDKIMNNRTKLADFCRKKKFIIDLTDLTSECIISIVQYLKKPLLASRNAIIIKTELVLTYYILYLQISKTIEEIIPLLESFGNSVYKNNDLGDLLVLNLLDIMQQTASKLTEDGWQNFNQVCDQLSAKLTGRAKFRLDQIRTNSIAVIWPQEWFK
ncbi:Kinase, ULK [Spironucleus salmonicida]|uniref:Kinase, ULK n=1 Tax=Spironucleus salmonicida TaxID=348837 RepID=V6LZN6_9EUKA|nr:Kinase, ULK [Spironucleus salmonicida]|eukprot:EST46309.1 Kinase, ULK [Spironucleus salmonicida]